MLYIVGTPIGNLEDLSYRQVRIINEVDFLLTEDTGSTGILMERIKEMYDTPVNPDQKRIPYNKDNEFQKLAEVLEMLEDDKEVALISQAGMPLVSDPGYLLVKTVIKKGLPFTVIPGPTATITALIHSGFNPSEHMFLGFLPKSTPGVAKVITKLQTIRKLMPDMVLILYESPNRIQETLKVLSEIIPDADVSISRELTKKFEETVRGKAKDLMNRSYKGELTVVIR